MERGNFKIGSPWRMKVDGYDSKGRDSLERRNQGKEGDRYRCLHCFLFVSLIGGEKSGLWLDYVLASTAGR